METSIVNTASLTSTTGQKISSAGSPQIASDFETFLSLLTAQMENQDPLEPLGSTEFIAQLAQFSSVEQQVASNVKLDGMLAMLSGAGASEMAQWIGREVRAPVALEFKGDPLELTIVPDPQTTTAALVVRDANGSIVSSITVDPSATELIWDGTTLNGEIADEGFYRFSIARWAGDEALEDGIPRGFTPVTEVRLEGDKHQLIVASGEAVGLEAVSAIRAAQSDPG